MIFYDISIMYLLILKKKNPSSQMPKYLFISACECINQVLRCTHEYTQKYSACTAEIVDWKKKATDQKGF